MRILRDGKEAWSGELLSGEANMCHSIANLEQHHFKYPGFRRPGRRAHLFLRRERALLRRGLRDEARRRLRGGGAGLRAAAPQSARCGRARSDYIRRSPLELLPANSQVTRTGMTDLHRNLVAGEWIEGEDATDDINPSNTDEVVGRYARGSKADAERAIAAAKAAFPAWSRSGVQQRYEILKKASDEILARKEELGPAACPRGGQDAGRGHRRDGPRRADLRVLRRRGAAARRRARAERAAGRRGDDRARAGRRRRPHHAVELPDRHPGLEARAGARLRQHGGDEARRPCARLRLGARRHPRPRRPAEGRA